MHYHAEVLLALFKDEPLDSIKALISKIMEPFSEHLEVEKYEEDGETYWMNPIGFWDWWQIGGRWTGKHDDYKPEDDPRNIEKCHICNSTGLRDDKSGIEHRKKDPSYTCNGCGFYNSETKLWEQSHYGKGMCLSWPTNWADHEGDIVPVQQIKKDFSCYSLIINNKVYHQEEWTGNNFVQTEFDGNVTNKLKELNITDGYLATVDYHS